MTGAEPSAQKSDEGTGPGWASTRERGSRGALRFGLWFLRRAGSDRTRILLLPIALYYCLFAGSARRASRDYLARLDRRMGGEGRKPGLRAVYRHVYSFAEVILDRLSLWAGGDFDVTIHGRELLQSYLDSGRGAFLVGAHLGSFDMLRVIARDADIPVNVVMYVGNAEQINEAIAELEPGSNVRVIDIDPTSVRAAFEIRSCIARGEFVAILGDRLPIGGRHRAVYADFLGQRAGFPQGPFLISQVLRLPVVLTLALKTGRRQYAIHFESISTGEAVAVRDRAKVLQEQVDAYAARLEHYCVQAPLQWFNFYDFWAEAEDEHS